MGRRGVAAVAAHGDLEGVAGGQQGAAPRADHAGRQPRARVQAEGGVGLRGLQQAFLDHHPRAVVALLAGLEHEHHAPGQRGAPGGEDPRGAQQHRHVRIVPAGVHGAVHLGGEVQARVLLEGQGVHVRAQEDRAAGPAALERRDDRGRLLARADVEPQAVERLQHHLLGAGQREADLGVSVDAAPHGDDVVEQASGFVEEAHSAEGITVALE